MLLIYLFDWNVAENENVHETFLKQYETVYYMCIMYNIKIIVYN